MDFSPALSFRKCLSPTLLTLPTLRVIVCWCVGLTVPFHDHNTPSYTRTTKLIVNIHVHSGSFFLPSVESRRRRLQCTVPIPVLPSGCGGAVARSRAVVRWCLDRSLGRALCQAAHRSAKKLDRSTAALSI